MAKILVTGATGYVGKRLIMYLLNQGHEIYALCYIKGIRVFNEDKKNLSYIWGDLRNPETLQNLPKDIEAAYYLVHSMSEVVSDEGELELQVVKNFIEGVKRTNIKQIIYLGGIINDEKTLSPKLSSRLVVEGALKGSGIATTVLRTSIIIGAGSAAFEVIRDLVEKMSIIASPKWVDNYIQPIAIIDVLFYLSKVLLNKDCYNRIFDIGGPKILSFKELMKGYAEFRQFKRWIFTASFLPEIFSRYWFVFISSVRYSICQYLIETMKSTAVVKLGDIQKLIPHVCISYQQALELAFQKIAQNEVVSTWMDSWEIKATNPNIDNYIEVPKEGVLFDIRKVEIEGSYEDALERIWKIGGDTGYYAMDWTWYLRGLFDQMIGGVGLNRGRRHPSEIIVGDAIDFWRVLKADKVNGHLILWATMKVPGDAWLEFKIKKEADKWILYQTATFRPEGLFGRLYWWSMYPFHLFIFARMANTIAGVYQLK